MAEQEGRGRERTTGKRLQGGLVALLAEKALEEITVRELCQRAGVSRSTFYLRYDGVRDLLEELEGEVDREFTAALEEIHFTGEMGSFDAYYTALFEVFRRHAEACVMLLGEHGDKEFVEKLLRRGREKCVREWLELYPKTGRERAERCYGFISAGCVGVLGHWFKGGCRESAEELGREVMSLVTASLRALEE